MARHRKRKPGCPPISRTQYRWGDGSAVFGVRLPRRGPGLYQGEGYTINRIVYPHDSSTHWYWQEGDRDVDEHYDTKWEASDALARFLMAAKGCPKPPRK